MPLLPETPLLLDDKLFALSGEVTFGDVPSMNSGYLMPHNHVCMPPMELPDTSRR